MGPVAIITQASLAVERPVIVILAGGDQPDPTLTAVLPPPTYTIAADSGVDHARSLDMPVDLVIGDLDSAGPAALEWARSMGSEIRRHPTDKDETDLELSLEAAGRRVTQVDGAQLLVLGVGGGRLDHLLANILVLAGPLTEGLEVRAVLGDSLFTVVRERARLVGRPGDTVSLLAVHGPAFGVSTTNLAYPLTDEILLPGSARGVSNLFQADPSESNAGAGAPAPGLVQAEITVTDGVIMAVQSLDEVVSGGLR
jgi:thiamine pyrophosphokinase